MIKIDSDFKTNYFNHDFNASNDQKIIRLESKKGLMGYAVFFKIIEMLHSSHGVIENDIDTLAYNFRCEKELVRAVVYDFDLFDVDDAIISNKRVIKQLNHIMEASERGKKNAEKRWVKTKKPVRKYNPHYDKILLEKNNANKFFEEHNLDLNSFKNLLDKFEESRANIVFPKDYKFDTYRKDFKNWIIQQDEENKLSEFKVKVSLIGKKDNIKI